MGHACLFPPLTLPAVQDADDLYFDAERKRIYIPGGEGYIDVYQQRNANHYDAIKGIQTAVSAQPGILER